MSIAVISLLAAAPCQRAVLIPLEPVATTPQVAKAVEAQARAALEGTPGLCVEPRADTVKRLLEFPGHRLPPCAELNCSATQLAALEADVLVQGVVLGAGGEPTVELTLTRARGTVRSLGAPSELPALLAMALSAEEQKKSASSPWPWLTVGAAGLVSAGVGAGFGIASLERARVLSMGNGSCSSITGAAFAGCLDLQLAAGKSEALVANILIGAGATLLISALVLWVALP